MLSLIFRYWNNTNLFFWSQIDLKFINRYHDTWPPAIACISGGILDLKGLITHRVPLEKAVDAMNIASDPKNASIKVLIVDDADVTL